MAELVFTVSGFLLRVLGVAIARRYAELAGLGAAAIRHRPVLRWYRPRLHRLASSLPLGAALLRFATLTAGRTTAPIEDLLTRDRPMLAWLGPFVAGM